MDCDGRGNVDYRRRYGDQGRAVGLLKRGYLPSAIIVGLSLTQNADDVAEKSLVIAKAQRKVPNIVGR
jgi:hypothetical protein